MKLVTHPAGQLLAACVLLVGTASGLAQTERADDAPALPDGLTARVEAIRPLYMPSGPLRLRFYLINQSDEAAVLPLAHAADTRPGASLPPEVILGTGEDPAVNALTVYFDRELPAAIRPWQPEAPDPDEKTPRRQAKRIRIAAHGIVGAEFDLRPHYNALRYPGNYRIEWRPFNGELGTFTTTFKVEPRKEVIMVTDYGKVTFKLMYDAAPRNVANFLELVRDGFYDGLTIHRVAPGEYLQGGCPEGTGRGTRPDGKTVDAELHDAPFTVGTLAMATKPGDPDSASCQFFITLARTKHLDGEQTVVAQAIGEDSIRALRRMAAVRIDENLRPVEPLTIRSMNLVDADVPRVKHLDPREERATSADDSARQPTETAPG